MHHMITHTQCDGLAHSVMVLHMRACGRKWCLVSGSAASGGAEVQLEFSVKRNAWSPAWD